MKLPIRPQHRKTSWQTKPLNCGNLRHWLIDDGSLTARLKARYLDFAVRPVLLKNAKAFTDELKLLNLKTNQHALIREVVLMGGMQPVVFAHSVLPHTSLRGAWRGLGKLGNKPLGAALFANPKVKRTPLEYKKLSRHHPISIRVAGHVPNVQKVLWARRSVFQLNCARILVTEVFLEQLLQSINNQ
jgi:chorismate--pyruvate lyase